MSLLVLHTIHECLPVSASWNYRIGNVFTSWITAAKAWPLVTGLTPSWWFDMISPTRFIRAHLTGPTPWKYGNNITEIPMAEIRRRRMRHTGSDYEDG